MTIGRGGKQQIAVVVYPGLSPLELVGTVSVLSGLGISTGFQTVTVGHSRAPVDTNTPVKVIPESTFAEVPHPFALLVPGGGLNTIRAMGDDALLGYVRAAAERAEFVASVGTGSLILASTGLLQGRRATTHWAYRRILENLGATYDPRRWVEDGRFVTSGGTSGGIDMALHLVAKHTTERSARHVQLWIEYDPQPPFGPLTASERDEDALTPLLTQHQAEWQTALGHRPDLLQAVQRALTPAAHVGRTPTDGQGAADEQQQKTIAFVLYPGLTAFDLVGPLQVIAQLAATHPAVQPVVVGERIVPMDTDAGVQLVPNKTFAEVPHPYAVVVPGGTGPTFAAMSNAAVRRYVRTAAETAGIAGSVCTGALILAAVGLLEGRQATTHWAASRALESLGATYQRQRWVEDGKFIMSAGVSAGIDMGLYLAARLTDEASARQVQLWLDYDPQPPFGRLNYDDMGFRFRLARLAGPLMAPLLTARPKRLTRQERAAGARVA